MSNDPEKKKFQSKIADEVLKEGKTDKRRNQVRIRTQVSLIPDDENDRESTIETEEDRVSENNLKGTNLDDVDAVVFGRNGQEEQKEGDPDDNDVWRDVVEDVTYRDEGLFAGIRSRWSRRSSLFESVKDVPVASPVYDENGITLIITAKKVPKWYMEKKFMISITITFVAIITAIVVIIHALLPQEGTDHNKIREALFNFYDKTNGVHWINSTGWEIEGGDPEGSDSQSEANYCNWHGIECEADTIIGINLLSNNVTAGNFTLSSLHPIKSLLSVNLVDNKIHGDIAEILDSVREENPNLLKLDIAANEGVTGEIPPHYCQRTAGTQRLVLEVNGNVTCDCCYDENAFWRNSSFCDDLSLPRIYAF